MVLLFLFTLFIPVWAPCPNTRPSAAQIPITLYSFGTPATASYAHILSTDPSVNTSTVALGITLRTEYDLAGTTVANYTADCPLSCFYSLTTKYAYNATMATASMARPNDQYPGLNDSPLKTVLCANAENACGATVPIYVYYNSQYLDYYVSTDGGGPTSGAASYGAATVPPNIIPGKALCWVWSPMTTTTVSTTTNTASTTTNTASTTTGTTNTGTTTPFTGSTTPYTGSTTTQYTGTTTPFTGSTTPPVTTTPYTGTTTRYTGTTTPYTGTTPPGGTTQKGGAGATPAGGENGDSTSSSSSSSSSSSWWKIPVIAIGVLLLLGVVIGLLGLLTVSFINPAPPKKAVVPYSPNAPNGPHVLPPQPVNAAPAPQPLTVGPSMGYTPAF